MDHAPHMRLRCPRDEPATGVELRNRRVSEPERKSHVAHRGCGGPGAFTASPDRTLPHHQQSSTRTDAMGFFTKDIKKMDDLFVHTLRDIYYAENQILQALPEMIEKSSDPQLKQGFQQHLGESKNHVTRLEQVFRMHRQEPKGVDCPAIDGIIEEANDVAGEVADKAVLDAALIAAAQ